MKLYDFPLSGHSYKARLLMSLADIEYQRQHVDLAAGEQKQADFLRLNPAGKVPVLTDDTLVVAGSHGILTYLAEKYAEQFLPETAEEKAQLVEWLGFVCEQVNPGVAAARLVKLFDADIDHAQAVAIGHQSLEKLEQHLQQRDWLVGNKPTIADVAVYPYVRHAEDGEVSLAEYPAIQQWFTRLEDLPGYVSINH
jgi:glutathione S-transferase